VQIEGLNFPVQTHKIAINPINAGNSWIKINIMNISLIVKFKFSSMGEDSTKSRKGKWFGYSSNRLDSKMVHENIGFDEMEQSSKM